MKVFLSWSGVRSKQVAQAFEEWIKLVIQSADPWISTDIEKGQRWNEAIAKNLEETKIGIVCLDKANLDSRWILFEAGAISKTKGATVGTFLLDVKPSDVKPPLAQFQHTTFHKQDIRLLMHTINNKIFENGNKTISKENLDRLFESLYPELEKKLAEVKKIKVDVKNTQRDKEDILEELLQIVRRLSNDFDSNRDLLNYLFGEYFNTTTDSVKDNSVLRKEKIIALEKSFKKFEKE